MTQERRFLRREKLLDADKVTAVLQADRHLLKADVIEYNSLGLSLRMKDELHGISLGQIFSIEIQQNGHIIGTVSKAAVVTKSETKISLQIFSSEISRNSSLIRLTPTGFIQVQFENQIKYNHSIFVKITDLSLSEAIATTSIRNRHLIEGMKVESAFLTVNEKKFSVSLSIASITVDRERKIFRVHFQILKSSPEFKSALLEHTLKFAEQMDLDAFKTFRTQVGSFRSVKDHLEYSIVQNDEEYAEVLKLRYQAYGRAGKVAPNTTWQDMADEFDRTSLILLAKLKGQIIASGRLTFSQEGSPFELESSITLPKKFLQNRESVCEVSRLCVDESFLSTNAIHGIFEWGFQYCIKMNIQWVISSTEKKLAFIYRKIGFTVTSQKFDLVTLNGPPHFFMHAKVSDVIQGRMNLVAWSISFGQVLNYLERRGFVQASRYWKTKVRIASVITKLSSGFLRTSQNKKRKAKKRSLASPKSTDSDQKKAG